MVPLTSSEIEDLTNEVAKKAVRETFLALGVNASEPQSIIEMQRDFAHIRESRLAFAAMKTRAYLVVTGTVVTSILTAIWLAVRGNGH